MVSKYNLYLTVFLNSKNGGKKFIFQKYKKKSGKNYIEKKNSKTSQI